MRIVLLAWMGLALFAQAPPEPRQAPWEGVPEGFRKLRVGKLDIPFTAAKWKAQRTKV